MSEQIICECAQCGADTYREDIYVKDSNDGYFCSVDCAIEFHGIEKTYFDAEYGGHSTITIYPLR